MFCRAAPAREIDRDFDWESRLFSQRFASVANAMLDELRPRERAACVSAWASQSESGQRLTRGDLLELCADHRADPDTVLPIFGYIPIARVNQIGVVVGPGDTVDVLTDTRRTLLYVDPIASNTLNSIWLLREAFGLANFRIAFHGETFTEKEH